ncbi:DUF916 domain-containing protein [Enterococcus devriesei]|uniref:DUF916 domain-containing protein n=1 Tax=Enterococcus devriesei TaxID=319970 RepID=UPI001C10C84E|nr:DUF916 domain-containing protein [Enterococcus devriesei]MBU5365852.1 DUF916 and DUF3324 domain-containing protein [Enterococcus devriesei]MDT2822004.1 DUF916 domain-containing protein [Enterococcus devriesei]
MKKIFSLVLSFILLFIYMPTTQAATFGFGASPIFPENQIDGASYFDLQVKKDQQQTLYIIVENFDDQPKTLEITPTTAFTNTIGQIEYSLNDHKPTSGPNFKELVSVPQTVHLEAKEQKQVTFQLTIPEKGFSGSLLGGFQILDQNAPTNGGIQQELAYVIGVMLREDKALPAPQLTLENFTTAKEDVAAKLANTSGRLISHYQLSGELRSITGKEISLTDQTISVAPHDSFTLQLPTEKPPTSGLYTIKLTIKGEKAFSFDRWVFLHQQNNQLQIYELALWPFILALAFILGSLILFIWKKRKEKRYV